jgi:MFS transporter, PAT family, solute carrier family 33 (acetyl-CoA transportor), member 1
MSVAEKKDKSDRKVESLVENEEKSNLKGDYGNMALLLSLYFLQGTISGLTAAIPILLQNRGVSYKQQALFSVAQYPFSRKIKF